MNQIEETARNVRAHFIFMLHIWSSKERQLSVPFPTVKFFEMWFDLYYPEGDAFNLAFNDSEKQEIIRFGEELGKFYDTFEDYPPVVEELVKIKEWERLNKLAAEIISAINSS